MAVADRVIVKQGDLLPTVVGTCLDAAGAAADLTLASAVTFRMTPERPGLAPDISADAVVVADPAGGVVEYVWQAGDTDVCGLYRAEFGVEYMDGSSETFPTDGYVPVEIQPRAVAP